MLIAGPAALHIFGCCEIIPAMTDSKLTLTAFDMLQMDERALQVNSAQGGQQQRALLHPFLFGCQLGCRGVSRNLQRLCAAVMHVSVAGVLSFLAGCDPSSDPGNP